MYKLSEVLRDRGYVYQHSSETLEEITDAKKRTLYLGIDPSADSLHVGQLMAFLVLRRFLEAGHKVILLIGGGTGMIGDPGGRSAERNLLDQETVERNAAAISMQVKRLFGGGGFTLVNNADWLNDLKLTSFLRDVGKHFSVNAMMQRDSVRERLENLEQGISYTEFSYMLLQAYDFAQLSDAYGCDVQVGGSDQWGNILSGVDYIRRSSGRTVYGLTWPLIVNKTTGRKFGKSEEGTVWLDAAKTSPFKLYQFFFNAEDDAVEEYLLKMTLLPKEEVEKVLRMHASEPDARHPQKRLALEVTTLVHGSDAAQNAKSVSEVLFGEKLSSDLSPDAQELLQREAPVYQVRLGQFLDEVLVSSELASSKREARKFIEDGAVTLNGGKVSKLDRVMMKEDFEEAPIALLKRGKRTMCVLTLS